MVNAGKNLCYSNIKDLICIEGILYSKLIEFLIDTESEILLINNVIIEELELGDKLFKVNKIVFGGCKSKEMI